MKSDNFLLTVAIIAVAISVIGAGLTYSYLSSFRNKLTGFATSGSVNVSVEAVVSINFTTDNINWGSGQVNPGKQNATLDTSIIGAANVTNGNWSSNIAGLIVKNIGNKNVTLNLSFGKNAAGLLGGTSPRYEFNVSNAPGFVSCFDAVGGTAANLGIYLTANTTVTTVCPSLPFEDTNDTIRIDVRLVIPSDSKTGLLGDLITGTFIQSGS